MRLVLALVVVGIALGGCELRGEKQDKRARGKVVTKPAKTTTTSKPGDRAKKLPTPKVKAKPPVRRPPRRLASVKPGDIKWESYTVADVGLTFDSFGKQTVREIKKNAFVATSQAPLNAFIFYSGKHTYEKELKRYAGRPSAKLLKELNLRVCGNPAKRREVNTGALTTILTGFKHKNTEMLAVWRVPTNLRKQYKAAETRFLNSIKCK